MFINLFYFCFKCLCSVCPFFLISEDEGRKEDGAVILEIQSCGPEMNSFIYRHLKVSCSQVQEEEAGHTTSWSHSLDQLRENGMAKTVTSNNISLK